MNLTSCCRKCQPLYKADKMNIANLGNMVPQLHIHIVARFQDDDAWPGPIWSFQNTKNYSKTQAKIEIDKIANLIDDYLKGETNECIQSRKF